MNCSCLLLFFFKQKTAYEILALTGVQTCALPIFGGALGGALGGRSQAAPRRPGVRDEIGIGERDYAAFDRALVEVQDAYSRQDVARLWSLATPEMAGYMQEELNDNTARGVVNKVSNVRLLQGDLAEAWREGNTDYATVAMRYALTDVMLDKASGRVVEGDPQRTEEALERSEERRVGKECRSRWSPYH